MKKTSGKLASLSITEKLIVKKIQEKTSNLMHYEKIVQTKKAIPVINKIHKEEINPLYRVLTLIQLEKEDLIRKVGYDFITSSVSISDIKISRSKLNKTALYLGLIVLVFKTRNKRLKYSKYKKDYTIQTIIDSFLSEITDNNSKAIARIVGNVRSAKWFLDNKKSKGKVLNSGLSSFIEYCYQLKLIITIDDY